MAIKNDTNRMIDVNNKYKNVINKLPWGDKDQFEEFASWVIKMITTYHNNYDDDCDIFYYRKSNTYLPKSFRIKELNYYTDLNISGKTMMKWVRLGLVKLNNVWRKTNYYILPDDFLVSDDPNINF